MNLTKLLQTKLLYYEKVYYLFTTCVLLAIFSINANAQDKPHQFSLGYGAITIDEELSIIEDVISSVISIGSYTTDNIQMSGAVILTYNYALKQNSTPGRSLCL